jgi:dipeptidyl aminopeptidase/acylaminoacyl peptidase
MNLRPVIGLLLLSFGLTLKAQNASITDAAAAFGARPSFEHVSLSPDGKSLAFTTPLKGQGAALMTLRLDDKDAKATVAMALTHDPDRINSCVWVANDRLACEIYSIVSLQATLHSASRVFAMNADGSNFRELSNERASASRTVILGGGQIMDLLPDRDGEVLMARVYAPDIHSSSKGLGVDLINTRTLDTKTLVLPDMTTASYMSDGRGTIRVMGQAAIGYDYQKNSVIRYFYRAAGSTDWKQLSEYDRGEMTGFLPLAVDPDLNVVYGQKKLDGRWAIYTIALDGSMSERLVFSRPDVDVGGLIQIGKRHRVVGATYTTELPYAHYFEPELQQLTASLSKAIATHPEVNIIDSSVDEKRLLLWTSRDNESGTYYLFDRDTHQLRPLLLAREQLERRKLAEVRPVTFAAHDGTMIPGYLTLPPGSADPTNLPAIVMPHGGPSARDIWGFNWLAQFFAARGYAVLQPNYRGSTGYGESWYLNNGFQSWPTAIGDVLDAGRWLVAQGIADPKKLGIVGWSYGGYAALQSAVVDPSLFKAVVAIAPVTDLEGLKAQFRDTGDFILEKQFIGQGHLVREGSPAQNADKIKVPVLMFHGTFDRTVWISQSEEMKRHLESAHVPVQLVTWDKLDHQLEDSDARAQMLRQSDAFLTKSFGP